MPRENEPFTRYNEHMIRAYVTIQNVISTCECAVILCKHKGMWRSQNDINCADGIHLTINFGYLKYILSLRDCIIRLRSQY